jgi:hypothetical protein
MRIRFAKKSLGFLCCSAYNGRRTLAHFSLTTMTDQELRDLIGSLAADTQRYKEEFAAERQKTEAERRKTDKQLRELGKQIGGIHDKFGKFAEGLMLPSLKRVVRKTFGVDTLDWHVEREMADGRHIELDARGLVNGSRNICVVIEVKSNLNQQELAKVVKKMEDVRAFFPEYASMKLYGVIAAIHTSRRGIEERVYKAGFYLARMSDTTFRLDVPKDFVPKEF